MTSPSVGRSVECLRVSGPGSAGHEVKCGNSAKCLAKEGAECGFGTRACGVGKEVTNRWDGEAESQWIVAARLLYHLQYLVPYLSRLQRIHLPDRVELRCKAPGSARWGRPGWNSRDMLLGAHGAALLVVG